MGADSFQAAVRAAEYIGVSMSGEQRRLLDAFHGWLTNEAASAGGIGPHELDRLWARHISDSLLFGVGAGSASVCLDIGSGVGLPGIPLAIVFPDVSFVLLDRSGRRCDLARRAVAVLGLSNCSAVQADVVDLDDTFDWLVSRAAIPPADMMIHVKRMIGPGGVAILGLSHAGETMNPVPDEPGYRISVLSVPAEVLDTEPKLLRIEAT
jgi:16S rRNA (guanine527-N7)-methyltransferase